MTAQPVTLADCITLTKGKPPAEMPYFGDDAEPYLSPEYLRVKGAAEPAKPAANAVRVGDGDTILLWDGSNAGEFFRGRKGLLSSTMTHIGHREEFEPEYFYYAAKRWEAYLKSQTSGSGIPHVDKEVLGKLEILQLAPGEQRLVAGILAKLDRAIEQTEAIIAKQQRVNTGLMQDLLTKGIDEHGNIRSESTHEFKDSPMGRIPVEWNVLPCEKLCKEIVVGIVVRPTQYYKTSGVPVLRSANVWENTISDSDLVFMSEEDNQTLQKSRLSEGDLVTVRTGYPGTTAVIPPEMHDANCVDIVISRPDKEKIRSEFLSIWINSDIGKKQVLEGQGGLAQQHFNVGQMRNLLVKKPPIDEQKSIVHILSSQRNYTAKLQAQLKKFNLTKRGLMHDLLTGKFRVTELLKQPAAQ